MITVAHIPNPEIADHSIRLTVSKSCINFSSSFVALSGNHRQVKLAAQAKEVWNAARQWYIPFEFPRAYIVAAVVPFKW